MRFALFVLSTTLTAQSFSHVKLTGGFKIGSPINEPSGSSSAFTQYTQGRWTGGPTVELHLPKRFSIEFDALYRNYRSNTSSLFQFDQTVNAYSTSSQQKTNVWDLPLLLKYRIPVRGFRPFVNAGYQWSHQSVEQSFFYQCTGPTGSCLPKNSPFPEPRGGFFNTSNVKRSIVAGGGLEFKTRYVTISPELRWSRPLHDYPRDNRFTGLVGFTFGKR